MTGVQLERPGRADVPIHGAIEPFPQIAATIAATPGTATRTQ